MRLDDAYHEGEISVQRRAGSAAIAARNAAMLAGDIMPAARSFLAAQPLVVVASVDGDGAPWASPLFGRPGFVHTLDGTRVTVDRLASLGDPRDVAWSQLRAGAPFGMLAVELATRRRLRINGVVSAASAEWLELAVEESFPNCPKYIQRRQLTTAAAAVPPFDALAEGERLDGARRALLERADTLFVASRHPTRGADASHRGGEPGFLRAVDDRTLRIPDYPGNGMFNTLGNLTVDDRVGLAIPDFDGGRVLQLVGRAAIDFARPDDPRQPTGGTGRSWDVHVTRWIELPLPTSLRWQFLDASPFNPGAP